MSNEATGTAGSAPGVPGAAGGDAPSVSIPVHVDFASMMRAKVANAARPSRLLAFGFAILAIGMGVAVQTGAPFLGSIASVAAGTLVLRLVVMAASSALDRGARRRFDGLLVLRGDGLDLTRPDGSSERHPWTWVLEAALGPESLRLRLDERGGRVWLFLSLARLEDRGALDAVRELLAAAGKLRG